MKNIISTIKKILKWVVIGIIAIIIIAAIAGSGNNSEKNNQTAPETQSEITNIQPEEVKEEVKVETEDKATISQKNALRKAESYLAFTGFSRQGLIQQLEFEQFSTEDATYVVDNINVNWEEQAIKKAKSYSNFSAFSRGSLINQLKFEGFTQEQAEAGATGVGL
jgi:hypothetical protein